MATASGTWRYRNRFGDRFGRTYFRRFGPGVVSSLGIGTYLGEPTDAVDRRYRETITTALECGINLIDTAVNYRCGRSETAVRRALNTADVDREEVIVATKGGFIPFDDHPPANPSEYVRREFVDTGLVDPDWLAQGSHCLEPSFLDAMLDRSRERLGLETIDCYYIHNPETQLATRSRAAVYDQLEAVFERLERRRQHGDIGIYGIASWDAFRVPPDHDTHLSLGTLVERAAAAADTVGAETHGFQALQVPFNVRMADAFTVPAHPSPGGDSERVPALQFADEAGLSVFASASLLQGELASDLPEAIGRELSGDTPAQRALNFVRSAPAVTAALFGTSRITHVRENIAAGTFDPLGANAFDAVFE